VSLPDKRPLVQYLLKDLRVGIESRFKRLRVQSFLELRSGDWLHQLSRGIALCNALILITDEFSPNVMMEVGMGLAAGKPVIPVLKKGLRLPSMLRSVQVSQWFRGQSPVPSDTSCIIPILEEAVYTIMQRETSDPRMKMQKRLLLGSHGAPREESNDADPIVHIRKDALHHARKEYVEGRFQLVISILSPYVETRVANEEMYHLLSDTWFLAGESIDGTEATLCYQNMRRVAEKGLKRTEYRKSLILLKDRALADLKLGSLKEARRGFERLLRDFPGGNAHYNLACVAARERDIWSALSHLTKAVEMEPWYQELARVDPDFDNVWTNRLFQALVFAPKAAT